jgi:hypothetical protein
MGRLIKSRFAIALFCTVLGATAASGVAWAVQSPVDGGGVIHGCYNPSTGAVKLNVTGTCAATGTNTPITWNAAGQIGPQGPPGGTGPQGQSGPTGPGPFEETTGHLYRKAVSTSGGACVAVAASPPGQALVVTGLHIASHLSQGSREVRIYADDACSAAVVDSAVVGSSMPPVSVTPNIDRTYQPGIGVPTGQSLYVTCPDCSITYSESVDVSVFGYVAAN